MNRLLKPYHKLLLITLLSLIVFLPSFRAFFYQDDFIHLFFSRNSADVIKSFNLFIPGGYPFYRPVSTQLYYFSLSGLFGLKPFYFHVVNFLIFSTNICLVFFLIKRLTGRVEAATLGTVVFAINATHIAPLYSAANVQELLLVLFSLISVILFDRSSPFSILFFLLALMSKETAVMLPGILFLLALNRQQSSHQIMGRLLPFILILVFYLIGHFHYYGLAESSSYVMSVGKETLQILFWYLLWSLSVPMILSDFLLPGFKLSPFFFTVGKLNAWIFLFFFPLLLGIILCALLQKRKVPFFGLWWFLIGISPMLPFPSHRLGTEQSFALVGLGLFLGSILKGSLAKIFLIIYLIFSLNSILLSMRTNWVVRSGEIAKKTTDYLKKNHPEIPPDAIIYFTNGQIVIPQYGSSKQIYLATGNGVGLPMMLGRNDLKIYYEDLDKLPPGIRADIVIDSSKLLY